MTMKLIFAAPVDKTLHLGLWASFVAWVPTDDGKFWIAILGAAIVKILLSDPVSFRATVGMFVTAVFTAWIATDYLIFKFGLEVDHRHAIAGVVALSGEFVIRIGFGLLQDSELMRAFAKRLVIGEGKK